MPQTAFLKNRFGLTPAEARLVLRLMSGDSLRSAAKALGIEYETVRTTSSQFSRKPERAGRPSWSSLLFMPSAICLIKKGDRSSFQAQAKPLAHKPSAPARSNPLPPVTTDRCNKKCGLRAHASQLGLRVGTCRG